MRRSSSLAMLVVAAVALGACSSTEGGLMDPSPPPPGPGLPAATSFSVTEAAVESVALPPPPFPDDVKAAVTATLDRYLQDAVFGPLRTGQPAGDLGAVFTGPARARVEGPDRAALVDEGLPAGDVRADEATAGLAALAGGDKAVTVVTAALDLRLQSGGDDPVTIVRTGHLVLVPDGGGWKIDGYDVRTTRDSPGGATTTKARG